MCTRFDEASSCARCGLPVKAVCLLKSPSSRWAWRATLWYRPRWRKALIERYFNTYDTVHRQNTRNQTSCVITETLLIPAGQVLHSCLLGKRRPAVLLHRGGEGDRCPPSVRTHHPRDRGGQPPHTRPVQVKTYIANVGCRCVRHSWYFCVLNVLHSLFPD